MHGYYSRKPTTSRSTLQKRRAMPKSVCSPITNENVRQGAESPFPRQKVSSEDEQEISLMYHFVCIIRGVWHRIKIMPLPVRALLALLALYVLSIMENILIRLVISSMAAIYTILGLITSVI